MASATLVDGVTVPGSAKVEYNLRRLDASGVIGSLPSVIHEPGLLVASMCLAGVCIPSFLMRICRVFTTDHVWTQGQGI
jgi:hypothetical protein